MKKKMKLRFERKLNHQPTIKAPSSLNSHVFLRESSDKFLMKFNINGFNLDNSGGCILITMIRGNFNGENNEVFKKSLSLDKMPLFSLQANAYNSEFLIPFSENLISISFSKRNEMSLASMSSSEKEGPKKGWGMVFPFFF